MDVIFTPDGKIAASIDDAQIVKVWNVEDGKEISTLHGHLNVISSLVFNQEGTRFTSASIDGTVKVWDVNKLLNSDLGGLLANGCEWLYPYLQHNPNVNDEDRTLCDDILNDKD